ncbi:hypothetical protein [Desulfosporosinus sp. FKB]|uniref:hypothetical protein n=1 Tax=Desulfosporosinus sp. FKB TaxID=1969835 RepID=UPI000B4996FC|nr:hypothetical protein [Desulfosporosinus sp. FKB]
MTRVEILIKILPDMLTELGGILFIIWVFNHLSNDGLFWPKVVILLGILIWLSLPFTYTLLDLIFQNINSTEGVLKSTSFDIENRMFGYYSYLIKNAYDEVTRLRSIKFLWKYRNHKVRLFYGEMSHTIIKIEGL